MSIEARKAFWDVALGNNTKLANLAKLAIQEAENESKRECPQAERAAWVGLTDEEIAELWLPIYANTPPSGVHEDGLQMWRLAHAVEAKLKEKST